MTSILSLATRWDFPSVRALAIARLQADSSLTPVDRILLARTYDMPNRSSSSSTGTGPKNTTRPAGIEDRVAWVPVHAWSNFSAPSEAAEFATDGRIGGYSAAEYSSTKLDKKIKVVTLSDIAQLLGKE